MGDCSKIARALFCGYLLAVLGSYPTYAEIIGENNLDDMRGIHRIPNQCYSNLGRSRPPSGHFYRLEGGKRVSMGSGDTVLDSSIIPTLARIFRNGADIVRAQDVVFSVYVEDESGGCSRLDHRVGEIIFASDETSNNPAEDYAIAKLADPVKAYEPLLLPDSSTVGDAVDGARPLVLMGFANHESTGFGQDISVLTCRGEVPSSPSELSWFRGLFAHDCDAYQGLAGAAFSVIEETSVKRRSKTGISHDRYFVGLHYGAASVDGTTFTQKRINFGVALTTGLRRLIESAASER